MIQKFKRYAQRISQLGPQESVKLISFRVSTWSTNYFWRICAKHNYAAYSWTYFQKRYHIDSWDIFFAQLGGRLDGLGNQIVYDESDVCARANEYIYNRFSFLGTIVSGKPIAWHTDVSIAQENQFDPREYYQDIMVTVGRQSFRTKDIKIPWELSRFQHIIPIGRAYQLTGKQKYSDAFVAHICDWQQNNAYLFGVNWKCPMDVALRAINWIWGIYYFKDADIDPTFWQSYIADLYGHMVYLEHNWELYDGRTSNHYLSDLVGYFYLCYLFKNIKNFDKKSKWVYEEIIREFYKQIHEDGTDYEGSTAYHGLVEELFSHAYLIAQSFGFVLDPVFEARLNKMGVFIQACRINMDEFVRIGDNDSGKVVDGIRIRERCNSEVSTDRVIEKHFPDFGVSIYRSDWLHMTLRHHVYTTRQPSGHFHNDVGSITCAIDRIPIIVDPGTYVYTSSEYWRNYFRSAAVHNSFSIYNQEPVPFDQQMFSLNMPERQASRIGFETSHTLYKNTHGLTAYRRVDIQELQRTMSITDQWHGDVIGQIPSLWNLTFHPDITITSSGSVWEIRHNTIPIAQLHTDLIEFRAVDGWYAPGYGVKYPCVRLYAYQLAAPEVEYVTTITW